MITPGGQRAYPLDGVRAAGGVVNDVVGDEPVVVLAELGPGRHAALAFSRRVGHLELRFSPTGQGFVDAKTGSTWSFRGMATDGAMSGTQLRFVTSHISEWFIWSAHYPDLTIWEPSRGGAG